MPSSLRRLGYGLAAAVLTLTLLVAIGGGPLAAVVGGLGFGAAAAVLYVAAAHALY